MGLLAGIWIFAKISSWSVCHKTTVCERPVSHESGIAPLHGRLWESQKSNSATTLQQGKALGLDCLRRHVPSASRKGMTVACVDRGTNGTGGQSCTSPLATEGSRSICNNDNETCFCVLQDDPENNALTLFAICNVTHAQRYAIEFSNNQYSGSIDNSHGCFDECTERKRALGWYASHGSCPWS
ncbi:hypothetical protein GQ44DRAFT_477650 [Phaeosphaeriaceae sp. PMI808]|nr:hypothetical protein GQ44DRAFT_477650 [Phaeosphaeriaceae sp. PMI808]